MHAPSLIHCWVELVWLPRRIEKIMDRTNLTQEIVKAFGTPENPQAQSIPKERVLHWMDSDDIQAMGAIFAYITEIPYANRITPPLSFAEIHPFVMRYFEQCIHEDPQMAWADSRYSAAGTLVNWFGELWRDPQVPREALKEIKNLLARLYRLGDENVRDAIVNGALEHLFENKEFSRFFTDWQFDPILKNAYQDAQLWKKRGGTSPLGKPQQEST